MFRLTAMTPFAFAAILLVTNLTSNWARRTLGPDRPMRPPSEALASAPSPAPVGATLRLETAETGNEVRYRVRERLVELNMPNDAIGRTGAVTGAIALDSTGRIIPSASLFTAQVTGLISDRDRRDRYVRERILAADDNPLVELAPTAIRGVKLPLPTSGSGAFELLGNLTIKGVTRPTVWKVDARFAPDGMTGTAATAFTFEDFGLTQPRVPVLLSVADTIRLEYTFRLVSAATSSNRTVLRAPSRSGGSGHFRRRGDFFLRGCPPARRWRRVCRERDLAIDVKLGKHSGNRQSGSNRQNPYIR